MEFGLKLKKRILYLTMFDSLLFNKYIRLNSRSRPAPRESHHTDWNSRRSQSVVGAPEYWLVKLVHLPIRNRENDVHSIDCIAYSMAPEYTCHTVRQCAILSIRWSDSFLNAHLSVTRHADAHVYCRRRWMKKMEQVYGILNEKQSTYFHFVF